MKGQGTKTLARGHAGRGRAAVAQARLVLLIMINLAQLWILAATVEAALAHHFSALLPLVIASGICLVVTLTLIFWEKAAYRHGTRRKVYFCVCARITIFS